MIWESAIADNDGANDAIDDSKKAVKMAERNCFFPRWREEVQCLDRRNRDPLRTPMHGFSLLQICLIVITSFDFT